MTLSDMTLHLPGQILQHLSKAEKASLQPSAPLSSPRAWCNPCQGFPAFYCVLGSLSLIQQNICRTFGARTMINQRAQGEQIILSEFRLEFFLPHQDNPCEELGLTLSCRPESENFISDIWAGRHVQSKRNLNSRPNPFCFGTQSSFVLF